MKENSRTLVTEEPIDLQAALQFVSGATQGAVVTFVGAVRDHNLGKDVVAVSYDVFDTLTETIFQELCNEACKKWGDALTLYIAHFHGRLEVGGVSVVIAASSPHRAEAFDACRYIIEALKHRAPIWKKEHYADGDSEWVKGHALCAHD